MEGQENPTETPDAFLTGLADRLSAKEDVDADLTNILKLHLLKSAPAQDAVAQAKAAILTLASKRAAPPEVEQPHG